MRVNATFVGFLSNRSVVRTGIAMLMPVIFLIASSFREYSDRDIRARRVNLIIRQIGHQLLLQAGDSTSRVMPVAENKEGTFLLRFENELVFSHDSLVILSRGLLPKTEFPAGYTVTVHDCTKGDIVYGFQLNNTSADLQPCSGRDQPLGCYIIEFVFRDLYTAGEQQKAGAGQAHGSAKNDPLDANPIPGAIETTSFDYNIDQQKEYPGSVWFEMTPHGYPFPPWVFIGMLGLLVSFVLVRRFRKIGKPVPVPNGHHPIIKESVQELPALGKFLLNVKEQYLLLGSELIHLTDKECRVLELLHKNFGELILRETLMQEVWISEGVITGRSLDMFVSKLRKKLSLDPELSITNVHGRGYKLEISEKQFI